jgi:hypothetical protein
MYHGRLHAAEEIQLLLPENQVVEQDARPLMLFGIGLLLVTLPLWSARLLESRTPGE